MVQVHLRAAAHFIQHMAELNPLEDGNLIIPLIYGEPEDMGPSSLHPTLIHVRHLLQDHSQPHLPLRETDPIYNRCLCRAVQCSP